MRGDLVNNRIPHHGATYSVGTGRIERRMPALIVYVKHDIAQMPSRKCQDCLLNPSFTLP